MTFGLPRQGTQRLPDVENVAPDSLRSLSIDSDPAPGCLGDGGYRRAWFAYVALAHSLICGTLTTHRCELDVARLRSLLFI